MFERPKLLLVVAQSGRMLAQSAAREGYLVRVADCYGDLDTLQVADRYLKLPEANKANQHLWLQAIIRLSDAQPCSLIFGTGIERLYPLLSELPNHIRYAGPSYTSIEQLSTPTKWIALLDRLALPYPSTRFTKDQPFTGNWLAKSAAAWGGTHIADADSISKHSDVYFQQQIDGISASVLFLASGNAFHVLLINQQFTVNPALNDFTLQAISNNLLLDDKQQQTIHHALQKLSRHLDLGGLMSLDFMINSSGEIFLLEINPRPTASCQLLPEDLPIISWQLMTSAGQLPEIPMQLASRKQLLWFCFAPHKITIPADFAWPDYCFDRPATDSIIEPGEILCNLLLEHTDPDHFDGHDFANKLIENLSVSA
ncbi:ATP-grasp domain-containing protein [Methylophaga sp.]|uniref:ATP-grasp domain-containing protein n=1 Tax=Methylophaga sp. TaxID=2024840 RepID=UPI0027157946|nr:ATP-grasp domain-containing protein [Methylophaga sp.]MDO8827000.1 ATP-grasp domain-containing protein [Methylophaga sp.]